MKKDLTWGNSVLSQDDDLLNFFSQFLQDTPVQLSITEQSQPQRLLRFRPPDSYDTETPPIPWHLFCQLAKDTRTNKLYSGILPLIWLDFGTKRRLEPPFLSSVTTLSVAGLEICRKSMMISFVIVAKY